MDYYKDKVCIVTGASSGIGFAISERLLKAGATVFMASRNAETLEQAYGRFSDYGDRAFRKQTDVTKNEEVEDLIRDAAAHKGRLDIRYFQFLERTRLMAEDIFSGKTCIVTGAASGIGRGLAAALAARGATVAVVDYSAERLDKTKRLFAEYGDRTRYYKVDVSNPEEVEQMVKEVAETGHLDYIFNNAGIIVYGPVETLSRESWERIININLWGVLNCVYAALPVMLAQGFGHIVNMASMGGIAPVALQSSYNATKFAVLGFTETIRYELARKGIEVTAICPGNISTAIVETSYGLAEVEKDRNAPDYPQDSISVEVGVEEMLQGIEQKKPIIVVPYRLMDDWLDMKESFNYYIADHTNRAHAACQSLFEQRMKNWEEKGTIW
jgi:NAD(P)-dependent dehydrogenase (short-subunit alcohol dehydrogenase family)